MKKPIISSKKKAAKARMADVKKIPSRGLTPTDKSVAKKSTPAYVSSSMKPKGISVRPIKEFPDSHFGALPVSMSGEGMGDYTRHMQVHGNAMKKGVDRINKARGEAKKPKSGGMKANKPAPAKTRMKMEVTRLPDTVVKKQISKAEAAKRVIAKMKKK